MGGVIYDLRIAIDKKGNAGSAGGDRQEHGQDQTQTALCGHVSSKSKERREKSKEKLKMKREKCCCL